MHPVGPSISIPTKLLATGVACALAILVCGTAATVVIASNVTTTLGSPSRARSVVPAVGPYGTRGQWFRDTGATALALDSLVAPLGPTVPVDAKVLASLGRLNVGRSKSEVWESMSGNLLLGAVLPGTVAELAHGRISIPLNFDTLRLANWTDERRQALDPWLPLFRQWARGPRQPALWGYRAGLPGVTDARDLPLRSLQAWRVLFAENEFASLLALRDGQPIIAMERARENVAGTRHFLEQPMMIDAQWGRGLLQRSLQVLAFVATSTGDSSIAHRALQLDSTTKNYGGSFNLKLLMEQEIKADSRATEEFAANKSFHPALRVESLSTITSGGCRSLPELVFGFSEKRRGAMMRAVANIRDIERGAELGALQQQFLEYAMKLRAAPLTNSLVTNPGRSALLSAFSWMVPPGVRARAALCLEQGL